MQEVRNHKIIIYQMMFHLWGNTNTNLVYNGSCEQNGVTKFKDVSDKALQALANKGFTHIYATGLIEHATMEDFSAWGIPLDHPSIVKGRAGSPFAIKDYYDVNPFLATDPSQRWEEFEAMLQRIHHSNLKLIIDFVPNHLARQYLSDKKPKGIIDFGVNDQVDKAFDPNNNFYYLPGTQFSVPSDWTCPVPCTIPYIEIPAKASGNNVFSAQPYKNDWFETVKLNYGIDFQHQQEKHFDPVPDTWNKLLDVLIFWTNVGVDSFRCDMAEMVPVEFWAYVIPKIKAINSEITFIAEIYQPHRYHDYIFKGGFDYLYDKVGLYDALRRLMEEKPEASVEDITRVWQQESGEFGEHMLRFLENHDETRINSPGFAQHNLWSSIPAMVIIACLHHGPIMHYMGQEFAEPANECEGFNEALDRTTMYDFWRVETHQRWMNKGKFDGSLLTLQEKQLDDFYVKLYQFVHSNPCIQRGKFFDLQYAQNEEYPKRKVYAFLRYTEQDCLLIVCNFDAHQDYTLDIIIPELALNMMGMNDVVLNYIQSFVPPHLQGSKVNTQVVYSNSANFYRVVSKGKL
ncbi:alpha-amylase family glycosyl hydrolase [Aquirufa rosea]|uniref:Alpha-amylase n=1 Tax=Aquirufa rosea TaxID=2509241 RepID=A0A4Q1C254_9BACT|nr:alpha-amylase family glycosyl hydrolase [Aquirufa rosea]RXK52300.1 alpha-amylase [Aquirufa rosea]